jgi:hypothetical protein
MGIPADGDYPKITLWMHEQQAPFLTAWLMEDFPVPGGVQIWVESETLVNSIYTTNLFYRARFCLAQLRLASGMINRTGRHSAACWDFRDLLACRFKPPVPSGKSSDEAPHATGIFPVAAAAAPFQITPFAGSSF